MNIVSTFVQPAPDTLGHIKQILGFDAASRQTFQLFVFDTLVDDKSLVTGLTVGEVRGNAIDGVKVTRIGQAIIQFMLEHHDLNYPGKPIVVAGVQHVAGAVERVRQILKEAPQGAAVLIVCADDEVYDAAAPSLGVDYNSAKPNTH